MALDFRGAIPGWQTTLMPANTLIREAHLVCVDSNGRAVPAAEGAARHAIGFSRHTANNLTGSYMGTGLNDGLECQSASEVRDVVFTGTKPTYGAVCYISGEDTVSADAVDGSSNPRGIAGICVGPGVKSTAVAVFAGPHVGPFAALALA